MFNRFFQHIRPHNPVVRLKIQGPINHTTQLQITERLNRIQRLKSDALLVVINSFGGSLTSAKNISARLKKYADNIQTPVYCFAQQFCLNSANIILTSGSRCYAHKFSVIGDFGYVYEGYDFKQLQKQLNIGADHISSTKENYRLNPFREDSIIHRSDSQIVKKILKQSQIDLKQQIFRNRINNLSIEQQNSFIKKLGMNLQTEQNSDKQKQLKDQNIEDKQQSSYIDVRKSLDIGLIDGVQGIQQFIIQKYTHHKLIQQTGDSFYHPLMQFMRNWKDSLKYRQK